MGSLRAKGHPLRIPDCFRSFSRHFWIYFLIILVAVTTASGQIVINEICHDWDPKTEPGEFVELINAGTNSVEISNWSLSGGIQYLLPAGTEIPPGGFLVIAENPAFLSAKYGLDPKKVLGPYTNRLGAESDQLVLRNALGKKASEVSYDSGFPWPTAARGEGSSMELIHPSLDPNLPSSWRSSGMDGAFFERRIFIPQADRDWRLRKGVNAVSDPPDLWRTQEFSEDATWLTGRTPVGYGFWGDNTPLSDMAGSYNTVFLRHPFQIAVGEIPEKLLLRVRTDGGFVVWINGRECARQRVPDGELAYDSVGITHEVGWEELTITNAPRLLVEGMNLLAIQALNNELLDWDFTFDAELQNAPLPCSKPTPGTTNSVYSAATPPQVVQVFHDPLQPRAGEKVTVKVVLHDPVNIIRAELSYQVVPPGGYIRKTDPAYQTNWTTVDMAEDWTEYAQTNEASYSAIIPAEVQTHRALIRYWISVQNASGQRVMLPYADDEQPNFAYFCYNGVPAWKGAVIPEETPVLEFPASLMANALPVYHLIAADEDVQHSQFYPDWNGRPFLGTLVYDGAVYDHIEFANRGEGSTYITGKNKWKFRFNRARSLGPRDNYGHRLPQDWHVLSLNACASPWLPMNRGMAGLEEAVAFRLNQLAGVPASDTFWLHFRVISQPEEASPVNQYDGDLRGLYQAVEDTDGQFLKAHGYADGNLYQLTGNCSDKKSQGPEQVLDHRDWYTFVSQCAQEQTEAWWRSHLDLRSFFSFQAINRVISNIDLRDGWNHGFYHAPNDLWMPVPWDLDALFLPIQHEVWSSMVVQSNCLKQTAILQEFKNHCRNLLDLLFSDAGDYGGQACQLVEELACLINPPQFPLSFVDVDEAMWDYHPSNAGLHRGCFYQNPVPLIYQGQVIGQRVLATPDHEGFEKYIKDFMTDTGTDGWKVGNGDPNGYGYYYLAAEAAEPGIPGQPSLTYIGPSGFPINQLQFQCSDFKAGTNAGGAHFLAMCWRLAEISNPKTPNFRSGEPWKYEINPVWESGELTSFSPQAQIPSEKLNPGGTYRVRVKMKDSLGNWSHWSAPVEFVAGARQDFHEVSVFINEWMASNTSTLADPANGHFEDWLELFNASADLVDLSGFYLSDDPSDPFGWAFPGGTTIEPWGYLLVWADGLAGSNCDSGLHASFKLSAKGDFIGLFSPDGVEVDSVQFNAQDSDVSSGRWPDGQENIIALGGPTPGAVNRRVPSQGAQLVKVEPLADGGQILTWQVVPGFSYRLEAITNSSAAEPQWQTLQTAISFEGYAGQTIITNAGYQSWRLLDVTDSPSLTASERCADGLLKLHWKAQMGCYYRLEFKTDLRDVVWKTHATPIFAYQADASFSIPIDSARNKYFRVIRID